MPPVVGDRRGVPLRAGRRRPTPFPTPLALRSACAGDEGRRDGPACDVLPGISVPPVDLAQRAACKGLADSLARLRGHEVVTSLPFYPTSRAAKLAADAQPQPQPRPAQAIQVSGNAQVANLGR